MPDTDHLNDAGLWCAGHKSCPYCRRCDSCSTLIPGRPHADVCSTPTECLEPICQKCTAWLRTLDGEKKLRAAVEAEKRLGGPKKPQRKPRATI